MGKVGSTSRVECNVSAINDANMGWGWGWGCVGVGVGGGVWVWVGVCGCGCGCGCVCGWVGGCGLGFAPVPVSQRRGFDDLDLCSTVPWARLARRLVLNAMFPRSTMPTWGGGGGGGVWVWVGVCGCGCGWGCVGVGVGVGFHVGVCVGGWVGGCGLGFAPVPVSQRRGFDDLDLCSTVPWARLARRLVLNAMFPRSRHGDIEP